MGNVLAIRPIIEYIVKEVRNNATFRTVTNVTCLHVQNAPTNPNTSQRNKLTKFRPCLGKVYNPHLPEEERNFLIFTLKTKLTYYINIKSSVLNFQISTIRLSTLRHFVRNVYTLRNFSPLYYYYVFIFLELKYK